MADAAIAGPARPPIARALFVATILVGSFLLFLIQPMVARMALPRLGGAPNVWNSAMLVYQALLLAGYAYAHYLAGLPFRRQVRLHLLLLAAGALTLPVALFHLPPPAPGWEVLWVPLLLLLTVGPVFLLVSAQAPLMQRWFANHPRAGAPWALYAASNLGSFLGLIAYPLLAEPLLSLEAQSLGWSIGYGLLVALVAVSAWARWTVPDTALADAQDDGEAVEPVGMRRMLHWMALAAVPSGLMLSTTTHLTTDIFAMPLLWVIPLGLYLLSFVLAFADNRRAARGISVIAPAVLLLAGGFAMVSHHSGGFLLAFASVGLLFVVSVALHARLYDLRPRTGQLTQFYLVMSAGGAAGGAFTAILAPVLFDWVWEHPLLVLAAACLIPLPEIFKWHRMPGLDRPVARLAAFILLVMAFFLAWLLLGIAKGDQPRIHHFFLTVMLTCIGLLLLPWRAMFVAVLLMLMLAQGGIRTLETTFEGERTRSYFGVYSLRDYASSNLRLLVHGTTLHGQQSTDPIHAREPMTYYGEGSGVAIALEQVSRLYGGGAKVGIVGLGTGTLACFRDPGQRWTFFEIDPAVLRFSTDGTFTFVRECAPDARIILGDARIELAALPPRSFDALAIDAFSSDAIPLHLLTDEAMGVYLRALEPDGILLVHISNRFIELEPVIAAIARSHGLTAKVRNDNPADRTLLTPSAWVALSRDPAKVKALAEGRPDAPWDDLQPPAPHVWTDDHASILPYIRWQKLLGTP